MGPSVIFKIQELSRQKVGDEEEVIWLATHESSGGIARFQISLVLKKSSGVPPFSFSKGTFIRVNDSQAEEFLRQVAAVLEAKPVKAGKKVDRLDFTVAILGQGLSRSADQIAGGFTSEPRGDWITTKVFVADGEGEFFLNLNPKQGVAEISIKDPDYGDIVLSELSRIF